MDASSLQPYRVKRITPRLIEIMNRMVLGQAPKEIREEFGITSSRFSIIINSPLFRLELKKKLLRREEVIFDIQENLLEGAKLGTQLYRDILNTSNGYPTELKLKAANAVVGSAVKLIGGVNGGNGGNGGETEEGKSYEERLREVTIRETIRTPLSSLPEKVDQIEDILSEGSPQEEDDETPSSEADLLFGLIDKEEDFEPLKSIEEALPKVEQSESNVDAD